MQEKAPAKAAESAKPARTARAQPAQAPPHALLQLQRKIGNRAVSRLVQTKLKVGQPGDVFEQEADRVADRVMRMPASADDGIPTKRDSSGQLRPWCQSCAESLGRRRPDDEQVRRKDAGPSTPATPDAQVLTSGGAPLPASVRDFYETRFDRDLSEVRVHTGDESAGFNDDLNSHAFAYERHIWMGAGQSVRPSFLLAHELAHVVQQSQPKALRLKRDAQSDPVALEDTGPIIRRFLPFFEPRHIRSGSQNHAIVLPPMGRENKVFTEAPVPNGNKVGVGYGHVGRADFYQGSTTVGIFFNAHRAPKNLETTGSEPLLKDGQSFDHETNRAPKLDPVARWLTGSAKAPKSAQVGDLKPSQGTLEDADAPGQLLNYIGGFLFAHKEANDPDTRGDGSSWQPFSASILTGLTVPDQFKHPAYKGQSAQSLVVKQFSSKNVVADNFNPPIMGHISVTQGAPGVWNYAWVPQNPPAASALPVKVRQLGPEVVKKVLDPLLQSPLGSPVQVAKKAKSNRAPVPKGPLSPDAVTLRRKEATAPAKDNFDYDKWRSDFDDLQKQFATEKKTPEFKKVERDLKAEQAYEAVREQMGLPLPELAGSKERSKTLDKIEFWTSPLAKPFGFFRKVFGGAFVKVAQFLIRMRDKIRDFLKKMKSASTIGGGFLAAAIKAAFRGLKIIARFVVGRVVDRIVQSLVQGVTNKIKALIGVDALDELQKKADEVARIREEIERKALDTLDSLLERAFGGHIKDIEQLKTIVDGLQEIAQIVNLVRWGARVVACLSPPAFGCLWVLAEGLLDYAAQKVAETCWFQEKIKPLLLKIGYVTTELPNKLADGLIARIKDFLPASVQDVFADLGAAPPAPTAGEVECDEEDKTDYQVSPLHQEIDEFARKVGPERAHAMSLLAHKMNVPADRALTSDMLTKLGDELVKVDPAALQAYAERYPAGGQGVPASLSQFVAQIENPAEANAPPTPDAPAQTAEPPASEDSGKLDGGGGKKETPAGEKDGGSSSPQAEKEGGGGGPPAFEARDRRTDKAGAGKIPDARLQIVNARWGQTVGDKARINVLVWWQGEARALALNVEVVVAKRRWYPETATSAANALGMIVSYKVLEGVVVKEVPDSLIGKGSIIETLLLTSSGEAAVNDLRRQEAARAPARP
jgi:Domain of unknown function (DUF4157)